MQELRILRQNGEELVIDEEMISEIAEKLRGKFAGPDDDGYDEARTIWNAMVDRRPGAVIRCAGAADVCRAVSFARDHELLISVRGGGHNIAGNAVCHGGLMIDLTPMKSVRIDPQGRTAWVEPGVTLGEFDNEAQAYALATPLGVNSTTGVAGLALGGGFGWLSRKHGFSVDNLLAADVVTAAGELVHASENENADLFWAIRGRGGNFGIVTSFAFRLHPVGPEVLSGLIIYPQSKAPELFSKYRRFVAEAPDELTVWLVLRKAPPLPFLPEDFHGQDMMAIAVCYAGDMEEGERAVAPLRKFGEPVADVISPHTFTGWQAAFDPLLTPGARNYWKSHDFASLDDATVNVILDYAGNLPSPECEIFVAHLGGASGRVAKDATAYPHRDTQFVLNVHTRWQDPAQDEKCVQWAREFFAVSAEHATGNVYVNFLTEDEGDRVKNAYGSNFDRLAALKAKYDPGNLFRMNQNIAPKGG